MPGTGHPHGRFDGEPVQVLAGENRPLAAAVTMEIEMQEIHACVPGRRATVSHVVADDDTAAAMHSGDVAVLATPKVLELAERAAVSSLEGCIEPTHTTVGSWVELDHKAPAPVGSSVTAEAVLIGVHGRRLEFAIYVMAGDVELARVKHRRVIVERARFAA